MDCQRHDSLEIKIDKLAETQAELVGLLREAVVKKDEFYREIGKFHDRLNQARDSNRKAIMALSGIIILLGGALGALLKT